MWKSRAAVDFSQRGRLTVAVRAGSLEQWGAIQTALASVDNVTSVQVTAMDIGFAQITLTFQGSSDQLREALGAAGLSLTNKAGSWTIAENGNP
jgi:hypothetical protein